MRRRSPTEIGIRALGVRGLKGIVQLSAEQVLNTIPSLLLVLETSRAQQDGVEEAAG